MAGVRLALIFFVILTRPQQVEQGPFIRLVRLLKMTNLPKSPSLVFTFFHNYSSIASAYMGFDEGGAPVRSKRTGKKVSWGELAEKSTRKVNMIGL